MQIFFSRVNKTNAFCFATPLKTKNTFFNKMTIYNLKLLIGLQVTLITDQKIHFSSPV